MRPVIGEGASDFVFPLVGCFHEGCEPRQLAQFRDSGAIGEGLAKLVIIARRAQRLLHRYVVTALD